MFGMMLLWLLVPAALIWLATGGSRSSERNAPSALQILEERFARGEIDADEFRTKRLAIEGR